MSDNMQSWQFSGEICEIGDVEEDTPGFRIIAPTGRVITVTGLTRDEVRRIPLFAKTALSLNPPPHDQDNEIGTNG